MVLVVLTKRNGLADVAAITRALRTGPFAIVATLQSQDAFAFVKVFSLLCESNASLLRLAENAISNGVPYMIVSKRKSKFATGQEPYYVFECNDVLLPGNCCVAICADENVANVSTVPPRWIREMLGGPERKAISLIALNAYVSTLGGGHYLCKHVKDAWTMALRQQAIALSLGDEELASQCRIHLAYICMQLGKLDAAEARLKYERAFAIRIESSKVLAVVHAAEVYLSKLKLKADELRHAPEEKTRDGFYRQRFVNVDRLYAKN